MDQSEVAIVQQWLSEHGFNDTLKSLETECGISYDPSLTPLPGELASLLALRDLHQEQKNLSDDSTTTFHQSPRISPADRALLDPVCSNSTDDSPHQKSEDLHKKLVLNNHQGTVLCVKFFPTPTAHRWLASSSSDKSVMIFSYDEPACLLQQFQLDSPVLALSWKADGSYLAAAMMSGAVALLPTAELPPKSLSNDQQKHTVFKPHNKYVIAVEWCLENDMGLLTGSRDGKVVLSIKQPGTMQYLPTHEWVFAGAVEAMSPCGNGSFAVSIRGDNYLREVVPRKQHQESSSSSSTTAADKTIPTTHIAQRLFNMNSIGDDHVSFTVLDMATSPQTLSSVDPYLLLLTDKNRMIVCVANGERAGYQVRNLWGVANDEYARPKCCWDSSCTRFVYCTSSEDSNVHVWDIPTQKEVTRLRGHSKPIRSLDYILLNNTEGLLASGSFDSSIIIWSKEPTVQ